MKQRLLYVFPEPFPLPKARGVQVAHTVHALAAEALDIDVAYVPAPDERDPFGAYGLSCPSNVRSIRLSRGLPWPLHGLGIHSGKLFHWRLRRWLDQEKRNGNGAPTAIMVRHIKIAYQLLQDSVHVPMIYEAHEIFADGAPKQKAKRLAEMEYEVLQRVHVVIAISRQLADKLRQRYGIEREILVVPSATSLRISPGNKDWEQAGKHIVYSGSFYGWKGVQDLVAAAEKLAGDKITLIGGDDASIASLKELAPMNGAALEFVGSISHPEVLDRLDDACIAVLPNRSGSVSEFTSPLKLFEYMAAGCAIVASDLPVMHEVLADDEASWFVPGDPESLAAAIRRLTDNTEFAKALGQRVATKAQNCTWEARARRLREVVLAQLKR